jgi:hypothetical protein
MPSSSLPIAALPAMRERVDGAERSVKANIARIKRLLADPAATPPASMTARTLQDAKNSLELLVVDSRQLERWETETEIEAERVEVVRLRAIIPMVRPLIQRLIVLAIELDTRARTGAASPRKRWRHSM